MTVRRIFLFLLLICSNWMCRTVTITVSPGNIKMSNPQGNTFVGVARFDITRPLGQSMGGYGTKLGKVSRGWWTRQYASSYYMEDKEGHYLIIVTTDLWSISANLSDRVIEYLHKYAEIKKKPEYEVARENLILTATHTHNAPGNMSSSWGYNSGSSAVIGYDKELVKFLARNISLAIAKSIDKKEQGYVELNSAEIFGLSRNRSFEAFMNNGQSEKDQIYARANASGVDFNNFEVACFTKDEGALKAIDPQLTTMAFYSDEGELRGILNHFGVHPTSLGYKNPLISSDLFGVARLYVENYFANSSTPIIGFVNGLEGDISANWRLQKRTETERLGSILGDKILATYKGVNNRKLSIDLDLRMYNFTIRNSSVKDTYGELASYDIPKSSFKMSDIPVIGSPTTRGSEDGRTSKISFEEECFFIESIKDTDVLSEKKRPEQGNKDEVDFSKIASRAVPKGMPLGLYYIGDIAIVTLPGEPTVGLGNRIEKSVLDNVSSIKDVIIFSLANEYMSYFSTTGEYMEQHYEGSSTVFGAATSLFLEQKILELATNNTYSNRNMYYGTSRYKVGPSVSNESTINRLRRSKWNGKDNLDYIYKKDYRDKHIICHWNEELKEGDLIMTLPEVSIMEKNNDEWKELRITYEGTPIAEIQSDKTSTKFLTYLNTDEYANLYWESRWMYPDHFSYTGNELRMKIKWGDGQFDMMEIDFGKNECREFNVD